VAERRTLDEIAREILPHGTEPIVVVDQFEELFTQTVDEGERRVFPEMMVGIASCRQGSSASSRRCGPTTSTGRSASGHG
jgi:Novel STAND NTPase 1